MTRFRDAHPIIYVADVEASLGFYRDLLGFVETYRFGDFVSLSLGESAVSVARVGDGEVGSHGLPVGVSRSAQSFELCVYADDVDAAIAELRAAGVAVLVEPADQPWGERMAYVADPDGHPVMICR
ncbi:lactoylglutathione lyase [Actinoplanes sp. OR16]|uniref:VOC family protein n=1 Tax=Actinoplanes sp. OR16 TaxID=946334 RepID=UPI000F6CCB86|nr:VOC family protein [Actinoplanes sp. OR16]BBH68740.1 lactoylglutathione lyase [Actinoplanes sp. OR16]